MTEVLRHRGPDASGCIPLLTSSSGEPFLFGQTHLRLISPQPIPIPFGDGRAAIVLNGQIYNWKELRKHLENKGYCFTTSSDIEVAFYALREWGEAALQKFNGMFAIAFWDGTHLLLARDRLGEKPLYFSCQGKLFAFASEVKALSRLHYAPDSIAQHLHFYFDERTPYREVMSLKPGEFLRYNPNDGTREATQWWRFPPADPVVDDPHWATDQLISLLSDSCSLRRNAYSDATLFLSGGVDSTLLQLCSPISRTFTCQFEEYVALINEKEIVERVAALLDFEAIIIEPTAAEFTQALPLLGRHLEMPVGSLSPFAIYALSRAASNSGYRVVISGEGADELFAGYVRSELLLQEDAWLNTVERGSYAELARKYFGSQLTRFTRMAARGNPSLTRKLKRHLRDRWRDSTSFCHNIAEVESTLFLQPLLQMLDRLTMASSLEARCPYLDYRIIEFSRQLHENLLYRDGTGKWILKAALRKLNPDVASLVLARPVKHGLPTPVNIWQGNRDSFERTEWNRLLLSHCLDQLASVA